ncbi:hypothetical protein VTN02DRAFT_5867 [Thermoascus thermophilus]
MGKPNPSSPSLLFLQTATAAALLAPLLSAGVHAWNADVHNQIGFMAESLLTPSTSHVLSQILAAEPQYGGSIGRAAAWADEFAHTEEGKYSAQWHYVDSADHPPELCSVYYDRDCTRGGCVVSAIANQTVRLEECVDAVRRSGQLPPGRRRRRRSSESLDVDEDVDVDVGIECARALKWVVHFIGDITQPLHASGEAAGGNGYDVIFNGSETNLHSVWDGHIIYALSNQTDPPRFSNQSIAPFFTSLLARIHADSFPEPVAAWTACADPSTPVACALSWARESNAWTCDYVYSQVINGTGVDLDLGYAEGAYPIVAVQVAKAAVRLGTWLNRVVEGRYRRDREVVLRTNPSWVGGPSGGA